MDSVLLKVLGLLTSPAKWLYNLFIDQTKIKVIPPAAENWTWSSFPVQFNGTLEGILSFAIGTESTRPVEVVRVDVHHSASLQIFDPGNRGFFVGVVIPDAEFPFAMCWSGVAEVRRDVLQAFAINARFPDSVTDRPIRISVHARKRHSSFGGFLSQGRTHVTTVECRVRLVSQRVLGIPLPPRCSLTTPQAFLVESGIAASAPVGETGSVVVHTLDADGTVSTARRRVPDA
jgi:hypothetical protein